MTIDLDDAQTVHSLDRAGLLDALARVPEQCADAFALADGVLPRLTEDVRPKQLVLCGAGVSGLTADFAAALLSGFSTIPVSVARGYTLPKWVGPETWVFALSYTGTTEETVYAVSEATDKRARVVVVTGGGHLRDIAEAQELPLVLIPRPQDSETLALGPIFFALWGALHSLGLLPDTARQDVDETLALLRRQRDAFLSTMPTDRNAPKQIAHVLDGVTPVFYGSSGLLEACARCWKFAVSALAGTPAFWNGALDALSEDVPGWLGPADGGGFRPLSPFALLVLRDRAASSLLTQRLDTLREQIAEAEPPPPFHEIFADGPSALARLWTAAFLGEWTAAYLSLLTSA